MFWEWCFQNKIEIKRFRGETKKNMLLIVVFLRHERPLKRVNFLSPKLYFLRLDLQGIHEIALFLCYIFIS